MPQGFAHKIYIIGLQHAIPYMAEKRVALRKFVQEVDNFTRVSGLLTDLEYMIAIRATSNADAETTLTSV